MMMNDDEDKKAAHVKWAGKTIALGTFSTAEAEEKCQRAKALTKAWRQTMRPKPSREWVMAELERLGVRIVAGRRGTSENALILKKAAAQAAGGPGQRSKAAKKAAAAKAFQQKQRQQQQQQLQQTVAAGSASLAAAQARRDSLSALSVGRRGSFTAALAGDGGGGGGSDAAARRDSLSALLGLSGGGNGGGASGEDGPKRRTSLDSLGVAASLMSSGALQELMNEQAGTGAAAAAAEGGGNANFADVDRPRRNSSLDLVRFLKNEIGFFDEEQQLVGSGAAAGSGLGVGAGAAAVAASDPSHRPLVGGGAAAAYEAARADHYRNLAEQQPRGSAMQRRLSGAALRLSLGLGSTFAGLEEELAGQLGVPLAPAPAPSAPPPPIPSSISAGNGGGTGSMAAMSGLGPNATPSQHYEMLKLHHMNLLQEIQETTMMMNLYQQQMLQEQQDLLREQQHKQQLAALQKQQQREQQEMQQQQKLLTSNMANGGATQQLPQQQVSADPQANEGTVAGEATDESADEIRRLREEIAERERKMLELSRQASSSGGGDEAPPMAGTKRPIGDTSNSEAEGAAKQAKTT